MSIYVYIYMYHTSSLLVPREVPNVKYHQSTNVTGSLKFKGQFKTYNATAMGERRQQHTVLRNVRALAYEKKYHSGRIFGYM